MNKDFFKKYLIPQNFNNRDLSWVQFNRRVMEEALDENAPLLEKVKFISIFFSNLDEFYMIRVSGLKEQIAANISEPSIDGLSPREQICKIEEVVKPMVDQLTDYWSNTIVTELQSHGVFVSRYDDLTTEEKQAANTLFKQKIFPVLTPLAADPGRPFPYISNLSLSIGLFIKDSKHDHRFARVKVPATLPRFVDIGTMFQSNTKRDNQKKYFAKYVWLEDLITANLSLLFPKVEVLEAHTFRITRDTDLEIQEDEADDLLSIIEENIRQRRFGNVVRMEVSDGMSQQMIDMLLDNLEITMDDIHCIKGKLGLSQVMKLYDLPLHQIKQNPYYSHMPSFVEDEEDIFAAIKKRDIIIHHPFESFNPVIDFIKQATHDPNVLAIKQTLYRVGNNSPIVKSLIEAAQLRKQVAVLVELKARFDEENNIYWARELEKAGVHVVYGLVGLKTHAKMTLVVRSENDELKRYVHLSTGNYNATTAKMYTDLGLFTDNEEICSDVSDLFNYLTGYSEQTHYNKLLVAPINLRNSLLKLIYREIENAKNGKAARIILKTNSIVDPVCIAALYEASNVGVKIDLIIRGICCLRPGVPELSENITVTSIIGRFLEHSRIFYFLNGGKEEVYLSSADIMQRNLDRRVEIAFPIEEKEIKNYLISVVLKVLQKDDTKSRVLNSDGTYSRVICSDADKAVNSQEWFMTNFRKTGKLKISKVKPK